MRPDPAGEAGDAAEFEAAARLRRMGYYVGTLPGRAPFDLFAWRADEETLRVEVKSTATPSPWGWNVVVDATKGAWTHLYVHTPELHFLIPRSAIKGRARAGVTVPNLVGMTVCRSKYSQYALGYEQNTPPPLARWTPGGEYDTLSTANPGG